MKNNIFDLAKFILEYAETKGIPICNKKLQKLCYYVFSWNLYMFNESIEDISNYLIDSDFEAWVHGPVSPQLYNYINNNVVNSFNIKSHDISDSSLSQNAFEYSQIKDIEETLEAYIGYSANELENLSHQEKPWINARTGCSKWERCNRKLDEKDIFKEFSERN